MRGWGVLSVAALGVSVGSADDTVGCAVGGVGGPSIIDQDAWVQGTLRGDGEEGVPSNVFKEGVLNDIWKSIPKRFLMWATPAMSSMDSTQRDQWVTFDMGGYARVSKVEVAWESEFMPASYELQTTLHGPRTVDGRLCICAEEADCAKWDGNPSTTTTTCDVDETMWSSVQAVNFTWDNPSEPPSVNPGNAVVAQNFVANGYLGEVDERIFLGSSTPTHFTSSSTSWTSGVIARFIRLRLHGVPSHQDPSDGVHVFRVRVMTKDGLCGRSTQHMRVNDGVFEYSVNSCPQALARSWDTQYANYPTVSQFGCVRIDVGDIDTHTPGTCKPDGVCSTACEDVTVPSAPLHGHYPTCLSGTTLQHGEVCEPSCEPGYSVKGDVFPSCRYGWFSSVTNAQCEDVSVQIQDQEETPVAQPVEALAHAESLLTTLLLEMRGRMEQGQASASSTHDTLLVEADNAEDARERVRVRLTETGQTLQEAPVVAEQIRERFGTLSQAIEDATVAFNQRVDDVLAALEEKKARIGGLKSVDMVLAQKHAGIRNMAPHPELEGMVVKLREAVFDTTVEIEGDVVELSAKLDTEKQAHKAVLAANKTKLYTLSAHMETMDEHLRLLKESKERDERLLSIAEDLETMLRRQAESAGHMWNFEGQTMAEKIHITAEALTIH